MSLMEWQISDFDTCNFEQIVAAIQRILYAADDSPAVIAEAQAIIYKSSNPSDENDENKARREINRRKLVGTPKVEDAVKSSLSPRQRRNSCECQYDNNHLKTITFLTICSFLECQYDNNHLKTT